MVDLRVNNIQAQNLPLLMGIVNVTPDSFYDGGEYNDQPQAVKRAEQLVEEGADILDIGGESTRPGAPPVEVEEEIRRVVPVVKALKDRDIEVPISVDTSRGEVARKVLEAGADWINDVWALRREKKMVEVVAQAGAPVILMHMQGSPENMQDNPQYDDVVEDILAFFDRRIEAALAGGVNFEQLILDPGIGFGKSIDHNKKILSAVARFRRFGAPVLVGHSRKSYLGQITNRGAEKRLAGTLATSARLIDSAVDIIRVHDVREHDDLKQVSSWLN
ncbi:MAG: dihydropteroate synthase [bacterium]